MNSLFVIFAMLFVTTDLMLLMDVCDITIFLYKLQKSWPQSGEEAASL